MADKVLTEDDIEVGDKVQIVAGGLDITNGVTAKQGGYYTQGGALWAEVESITKNWQTGGLYGQPATVTKVRCSNQGIVVWQVQPKHIAPNIQKKNPKKEEKKTPDKKTTQQAQPEADNKPTSTTNKPNARQTNAMEIPATNKPYVPVKGKTNWMQGRNSIGLDNDKLLPETIGKPASISNSMYDNINPTPGWTLVAHKVDDINLPYSIKAGTAYNKYYDIDLYKATYLTSYQNENRRKQMLNRDESLIQNDYKFPIHAVQYDKFEDNKNGKPSTMPKVDLYDYQIILDDPRLKQVGTKKLEDQLAIAREQLGIPVHGKKQLAKSMKFYMYNRFKVPDTNLAHSRSVTYVFFTRPDLNLLMPTKSGSKEYTLNKQLSNHTESALLWKQHPELFKLLTDHSRCGDKDNFNFLLSNQCTSFDIQDEKLNTNTFGKSWNGYTMNYGDQYDGRGAGTFSCNFTETKDYSIIKLMKLWITYIDNVSRGAWHPSYNLQNRDYTQNNPMTVSDSHVFTKTLDYAAAAYVFKCAEDGETVLYWSSYHGVFPTDTAANCLGWDMSNPIGDGPKPTITFAYSWKRDLNPISLLEFNSNADILKTKSNDTAVPSIASFNEEAAGSAVPFVGCPFIEMDLGTPHLKDNGIALYKETTIKLKFKKDANSQRARNALYRNAYAPAKTISADEKLQHMKWQVIDPDTGTGEWIEK